MYVGYGRTRTSHLGITVSGNFEIWLHSDCTCPKKQKGLTANKL